MQRGKPIRRFEKTISKPLHDLEYFLFDIREGTFSGYNSPYLLLPFGPCLIKKEGQCFEATYARGSKLFIVPDPQHHSISFEGEWWYRGVYSIREINATQSLLVYEVYNAAPQFRWMIPLVLKSKAKMAADFDSFIQGLELVMDQPRRKVG